MALIRDCRWFKLLSIFPGFLSEFSITNARGINRGGKQVTICASKAKPIRSSSSPLPFGQWCSSFREGLCPFDLAHIVTCVNVRLVYRNGFKSWFLLRQLGCKFLILTRALPLGNGRSFRMQKLRRFLAKSPTFESISVSF